MMENVRSRYLLTGEADTSVAGAAGAARGEEAAAVPAGRGLENRSRWEAACGSPAAGGSSPSR